MKENEDDIDNDKILLTNNELEKELLDGPLINFNDSGNANSSLNSINDEIKDSNNNSLISSSGNINQNNYDSDKNNIIINKINFEDRNSNKSKINIFSSKASSKRTDEEFEKNLLYNIDFEKTQRISEILNEDINKAMTIVNDDMNILQRASFLNKISSVKTIIKELKNKLNKENDINILNNFINSKNKRGYTSLHYSIICGNFEIYKFLIKNGADRNIATNSGYNNLILACQTKRTYVFLEEIKYQIMNKGLDICLLFNIKDKNNATLLHWSAFSDYLFGTQYLLSLYDKTILNNKVNFVNFINSRDNNNMTALQYALMNNSNKVIKDLILLENIDLYNNDVDKRDCFDYAEAMKNETFDEVINLKNTKFNIFKRFLYIILIILYNAFIYFITLPILNKLFILYIQLAINFLLILFYLIIKIIINPGYSKGNSNTYTSMIFSINENNIYRELTEIIRYCPYCYIKKEKTTTKHCPICNACVENFIMHDIFFNKCIGRKNYFFYILFKLIFLVYLSFFIAISFWSIFIDLDQEKKEIVSLLIKVDKFYCDEAISILSYGTIFLFIAILFFKIWELYKECKLKNNVNILRHSLGLDKINRTSTNNLSRKESIM